MVVATSNDVDKRHGGILYVRPVDDRYETGIRAKGGFANEEIKKTGWQDKRH